MKLLLVVHRIKVPYESRIAGEDSLKAEADKVRVEIVRLLQAKVTLAGVHVMNNLYAATIYITLSDRLA